MAKTETDENYSSNSLRITKELIIDEQKIVTYVSLSKELCIHINEAKKLLTQVVDDIKKKTPNIKLNVSFLISGLSSNNCSRTIVCPESDLEAQRNTLKTVFFQHIYSVSQGTSCLDNAAFVSLNKFEDFSLCCGLIKGNSCTKRSSDEIGTLKSNSQKTVEEKQIVVLHKKEPQDKTKNVTQKGQNDNNVVDVCETKSEPIIKSEVISPKKAASNNSNGKSSAKNGIKSSKGIAGFFTKSNSAPNTKFGKIEKETVQGTVVKIKTELGIKSEIQPKIKKETQPNSVEEIQPVLKKETQPNVEKEIQHESMDVDEEIPVKDTKKQLESTKKSKNKKNSSLNQIKKTAKVDKKRKRVLHVSDSESDDENDPFANEQPRNNESDDEIPPTPSTNTVKITSGIFNPMKRRKIVDKTYTDEEGYILTRKEEVYESCSDDEAKTEPIQVTSEKENMEQVNKVKTEVSPKEKKPKSSKKKISPPTKGKQGNIMNFFKKI